MSTASSLPAPRQKRSRETLRRILDAFEMALESKTFEEVTVVELCEAAGCSVGTFYGRVESKDGLLDHLRDRVYEEFASVMAEVFDPARARGMQFEPMLREQAAALVDIHHKRKGVIRALIVQARRRRAFGEQTQAFNARMLDRIVSTWSVHGDAIAHSDPELACQHASLATAGYLREAIVFGELWPQAAAVEASAHVEALLGLITSYLLGRPPMRGQDDDQPRERTTR